MYLDMDEQLNKVRELMTQKQQANAKLREVEQKCVMLERDKVRNVSKIPIKPSSIAAFH